MNYDDVLPENWMRIARDANNAYLKRKSRHVHPLLSHHKICLDQENLCPGKRLGGCIMWHCVLRYPTPNQYNPLR